MKLPWPLCPGSFPQDEGPNRLVSSLCCVKAQGRTRSLFVQLHELQTVTANSLCFSLQVESLDIRYVYGVKEADTLFRSLPLSLAETTQEQILSQAFKASVSCWYCASWGLTPACVGCSSWGACVTGWLTMLVWNGCKSSPCCRQEQGCAAVFECFSFSLPFLTFLQLTGLQNLP